MIKGDISVGSSVFVVTCGMLRWDRMWRSAEVTEVGKRKFMVKMVRRGKFVNMRFTFGRDDTPYEVYSVDDDSRERQRVEMRVRSYYLSKIRARNKLQKLLNFVSSFNESGELMEDYDTAGAVDLEKAVNKFAAELKAKFGEIEDV